ncbi:DNA polymerase domain-containing protein [Rhizobium phage RHEph12]|nr:DNA polymerase domain-containing protein [Rhizobium phage RHEph12]
MATNTRKLSASAHAAVDEIASGNPELLEALVAILNGLMAAETAVVVPAGKKGAKKVVSKSLDDEDEDDDNDDNGVEEEDGDDDDNGGEEEDEDDDADLATLKKGSKKAASTKPAAPAKGKGGKVADLKSTKKRAPEPEPEEEEEEEADEGDGEAVVDIEELTVDGITEAFQNIEEVEKHERVTGGIKELTAFIDDIGYDTDGVIGLYKAKTTAEKKAALTDFASKIEHTLDGIMAYELSDVVALVAELTDDADYKPKGRAAADKELNAARDLFRAVTAAE